MDELKVTDEWDGGTPGVRVTQDGGTVDMVVVPRNGRYDPNEVAAIVMEKQASVDVLRTIFEKLTGREAPPIDGPGGFVAHLDETELAEFCERWPHLVRVRNIYNDFSRKHHV